ncbi:MAG: amino acid transporter, partial [Candidatus Wallbacteria bacterium]|nr:amino acid transporter [Candidatus Wallbacteria bacterium]
TGGDVGRLVVMYSINVFLTFSLTEIAMCRFWFTHRDEPARLKNLSVHGTGLVLCMCILIVTVIQKFAEGGWLTVVLTGALIGVCWAIRTHYERINVAFRSLADTISSLPMENKKPVGQPDPKEPTAILLVGGYGGLGVHSLLSIFRFFPGYFKNFHFVTVGVLDSGNFKGQSEVENLRKSCEATLERYVTLANRFGYPAAFSYAVGTDIPNEAEQLCVEAAGRYQKSTTFAGKLVFERELWYHRLLHNETAIEIQRRLQWSGQAMVILPVRVLEMGRA